MTINDFLTAAVLDAIRAAGVFPVTVSIGDPTNKATWSAELDPGATPAQQQTAATTIANFDLPGFPARLRVAQFASTSRQKDVLATIALIVRAKGVPAWNALTTPQKVAATLAEADVWANIRDFIETNT